jgi:hypothetical protein
LPQSEWLSSRKQITTNAGKDVEEKKPLHTFGEMYISAATMEISSIFRKLNIEPPYDSAIPILGIEVSIKLRHLHIYVYNNTIHNNQNMELA